MTKKVKINLFDSLVSNESQEFWGTCNFSGEFMPEKIEWIRPEIGMGLSEFNGVTVFTDKDLLSPWVDKVSTKYKVAWIVECREIHPFAYEHILLVENKFDYIFTFDEKLLARGPKYIKNLIGGSRVSNEDAGIHKKKKLLSLIASNKKTSRGHRLRHVVANAIKNKYDVDLWGSAYKPFGKNNDGLTAGAVREGKNEPLKKYFFSITIMNSKQDSYFTETLIDVFRQGTIPIFWGCNNIGDYFNEKGILQFNTGPELINILDNLSEKEYFNRIQYINENFDLAKQYLSIDNTFATNLFKTIPEL